MDERRAAIDTLLLATCQALFMSTIILTTTVAALAATTLLEDPTLATLPQAAVPLVTMALALPASLLMRRVGRRAGFALGATFGIASGATCSAALTVGSYALFLVGMALLGAYQAFATYYRFAVADAAPEALRARSVSLVLAGGVVAAVLGPTLASSTRDAAGATPYLGSYLASIGLNALALGAIACLRLRAPARPVPGEARPSAAALLRRPGFVLAAACCGVGRRRCGVGQAVMVLVMTATPLAMLGHGYTLGVASLVVSWHVLAMFVPSFFSGALIARFGLRRVLGAGTALMVGSALVAIAGTSAAHFAVALVVNGLAWNFLFVGGSALLVGVADGAERAVAQGLNELATFGCGALATFASGALYFTLGWRALNVAGIGAALALGALLLALGRRPFAPPAPSVPPA